MITHAAAVAVLGNVAGALQIETLRRLRNGGSQFVRVEHASPRPSRLDHHRAGMRVGRSRPPPPPPPIVATDWLPSTIFAVFLACAHVTAASKTMAIGPRCGRIAYPLLRAPHENQPPHPTHSRHGTREIAPRKNGVIFRAKRPRSLGPIIRLEPSWLRLPGRCARLVQSSCTACRALAAGGGGESPGRPVSPRSSPRATPQQNREGHRRRRGGQGGSGREKLFAHRIRPPRRRSGTTLP